MIITLIPQKKTGKSQLNSIQKNFDRLKKSVDDLQLHLKSTVEHLDSALHYYLKMLYPVEKEMLSSQTDFVKQLYSHHKNSAWLSEKERKSLKKLISYQVEELFSRATIQQVDPEICAIFKDLEGIDYSELVLKQLASMQGEMADSSDESEGETDHSGSEEINELDAQMRGEDPTTQAKSPSELERERRVQELKELQEKGLGAIYKQLAKIVHPDLEPDPILKQEKEALMKKLTVAYESHDLHALLSLERELMSAESHHSKTVQLGEEKLKVYNSILKEQVQALKDRIGAVHLDSKYWPMMQYAQVPSLSPFFLMEMELQTTQYEMKKYRSAIKKLRGWRTKSALRSILAQVIEE